VSGRGLLSGQRKSRVEASALDSAGDYKSRKKEEKIKGKISTEKSKRRSRMEEMRSV
jgi:hypothetical protein